MHEVRTYVLLNLKDAISNIYCISLPIQNIFQTILAAEQRVCALEVRICAVHEVLTIFDAAQEFREWPWLVE